MTVDRAMAHKVIRRPRVDPHRWQYQMTMDGEEWWQCSHCAARRPADLMSRMRAQRH